DRVGVLDDGTGAVLARVEVGGTPGAAVDTRDKRGPRGLALHPTAPALYVMNALSNTLIVIDTLSDAVVHEQPVATVDPMPARLREGRKFLYDSKLSGNGTMSCAACHVDGDTDGLAWDLGDPGGALRAGPQQPFPFSSGIQPYHPMKGPLTTQTLRGLENVGPLHWRGDKPDFHAFNATFDGLMGGALLGNEDMADFADFATAIRFPPNPNQRLDRALRTAPADANEAAGFLAFHAPVPFGIFGTINCNICHTIPTGTNGFVVSAPLAASRQQLKVAQLRNLYRKIGMSRTPGPQKSGFGYSHTGAVDSVMAFLSRPVFSTWPAQDMDDIATYLMAFDTGTAPLVGFERVVSPSTVADPQLLADAQLLKARAQAGDIDLTARGVVDGVEVGMLYDLATNLFYADDPAVGPYSLAALGLKAQAGEAAVQLLGVTPGSGERLALDRDLDGVPDGVEAAASYGAPSPGCSGAPTLRANSEPFVGNAQFALTMANTRPITIGILALSMGPAQLSALGVDVHVDPLLATTESVLSDSHGESVRAMPLPPDPTLSGTQLFAQTIWLDPCEARRFTGTAGLMVTVRP
ncbi:MAG: hypothetical protein ACON4Z_12505, partial [Planctomycetota bacterium]